MGLQYSNSLFASFQYLPIPSVALHLRKRWKRNILINGKRNGARSPYVSFLETRNAQGATFIVSWKRNTREIRACFLCFLFPVFRLRPYTPSPTHCRRLADEHQRPTTDNDNSQRRRAKNSSQLHGNKTTMPLRGVCVTNQHFTRPRGRIPMANMQYRNEV